MNNIPSIKFAKPTTINQGCAVFLVDSALNLGHLAKFNKLDEAFARAFEISKFEGKSCASLDLLTPAGSSLERAIVIGIGDIEQCNEQSWRALGGATYAKIEKCDFATVVFDCDDERLSGDAAAQFALGMMLRSYKFNRYMSKEKNKGACPEITILCADHKGAEKAFDDLQAIGEGVILARDLINEPANILGTEEFADYAKALSKLGVEVEILDEKELKKQNMHALLNVARGSKRPPKVAIMQWNGGKAGEKPIAFIGKGVVFDSGGISLKPGGGMEDMKGDMGGAAAVTGLMHALAGRKAKVNVVGVIGLVENMPDADAMRPGDIVTARSGTTIEVINTDAEGRLVLCDLLDYTNEKFEPKFMINLATLTGAILVALGHEHAGLFSNNDELSQRLIVAGLKSGEKLWRMPLGKEYDKLIESKFADIKNVGGRFAGSITAAQFLQRFVGETPWAHLDIAGVALGSPKTEISKGWTSGYGVMLLDELVRAHYE